MSDHVASISIIKIVDKFNLQIISNSKSLQNQILVPELNIGGLELVDFFWNKQNSTNNLHKRPIILGEKESIYLNTFTNARKIEKIKYFFKNIEKIPAIYLGEDFNDKDFIRISKKYCIPILRITDYKLSEFINLYVSYLNNILSDTQIIHGSFVNIFGKGVLIMGSSGIGKSEVVLELIKKHHLFIADDAIVLNRNNAKIYGRAAETIQNYLEIRGIGLIDIPKLYGAQIMLDQSRLDMIISLKGMNLESLDRLGNAYDYKIIQGIKIPKFIIPVTPGRKISEIIETAVAKYKSDALHGNSFDKFNKRFIKILNKRNKK